MRISDWSSDVCSSDLSALGVKLVLVHGSRPQVNEQLKLKGFQTQFGRGTEPTSPEALECAKEAAGEIRLDIEAAFSQGLPNTPMSHAQIRVISGNFVTESPAGVIARMSGVKGKRSLGL